MKRKKILSSFFVVLLCISILATSTVFAEDDLELSEIVTEEVSTETVEEILSEEIEEETIETEEPVEQTEIGSDEIIEGLSDNPELDLSSENNNDLLFDSAPLLATFDASIPTIHSINAMVSMSDLKALFEGNGTYYGVSASDGGPDDVDSFGRNPSGSKSIGELAFSDQILVWKTSATRLYVFPDWSKGESVLVNLDSQWNTETIDLERDAADGTAALTLSMMEREFGVGTYAIAPADDPTSFESTLRSWTIPESGQYFVRKNLTQYFLLDIHCYFTGSFSVEGHEYGKVYYDGEDVTGRTNVKMYDDEAFELTAEPIDGFVCSFTGAVEGINPAPTSKPNIIVNYIDNRFATVSITKNIEEGGEVFIKSLDGDKTFGDKIPAGTGFKVEVSANTDKGYILESCVLKKGEEPLSGLSVESVSDKEVYTVEAVFVKAELNIDDVDVNLIDIKNKKFDEIKDSIINEAEILPEDFADGASIDVKYYAGRGLSGDKWADLDFEPSLLEKLVYHEFGYGSVGGDLEEGNTERVFLTVSNENYLGIILQKEITANVKDLRKKTFIICMPFTITYGDDITEAVLNNLVIVDEDDNIVDLEDVEIAVSPEKLDYKFLQRQDVTINFAGNDEYKPSEGTGSVYVLQHDSRLKVVNETITYGETAKLEIQTEPENLDNIRVLAGIDGDAKGFVSIDIPQSVKDKMVFEIPVIGTKIDLYQILADTIGDGLPINSFKDEIVKILKMTQEEPLKSIIALTGFDVESLGKIVEILDQIPTLDVDVTVALSNPPKNAGIYLVGAVSTNLNYKLAADIGYLTILPETDVVLKYNAAINNYTLTWAEAQTFDFGAKVYDEENNPIGETADMHVHSYFTGITDEGIEIEKAESVTEPGIYTQFTYSLGGNYLPTPIQRTFTIQRENVVIDINDDTVDYDGKKHGLTATAVAEDGTDFSDQLIVVYYNNYYFSTEKPVNAGTYAVTATYLGDFKYKSASETAILTINKADVTITLQNKEVTYGDIPERSADPEGLEYVVEGVVDGDTLHVRPFVYKRNTGYPEVGEYTISALYYFEDLKYFNYNVILKGATLDILPLDVDVVIESKMKYYTEEDPALTYILGELPYEWDELEIILTRDPGEEVGRYFIHGSVNPENENFNVHFKNDLAKNNLFDESIEPEDEDGIFDIIEMPITITIDSKEKYVGDKDPEITATVVDINGKKVDPNEIGLKLTRKAGEEPGEYEITAEFTNERYTLDKVNKAKLTIKKNSPATGDRNNMGLWLALAILCALIICLNVFMRLYGRKRNK